LTMTNRGHTYSLVTRVTRKAGYLMHVYVHGGLTLRPTVVQILTMNNMPFLPENEFVLRFEW
jgi:hypothetical protein